VELADTYGYRALPTDNPEDLATIMHQGDSGSLRGYLAAFDHTTAVMQHPAAVERVAYEAAIDHAVAGVVYAEIRFGPSLLTGGDMGREDAIEAALAGLALAGEETGITTELIVSALRQHEDSLEVAMAASHFLGQGVVAFDLAGPEIGYPADNYLAACRYARDHGLGLTLHAGEAAGMASIAAALGKCGAQRIGHGVRIIDDCTVKEGAIVELGALATTVRDHRVPLEVSISSNLHTGVADAAEGHPFGLLYRAGFNVSINTDNRLMSGITMATEFELAADAFDLDIADLQTITTRALEAGFGDWDVRRRLIEDVVAPAYSAVS